MQIQLILAYEGTSFLGWQKTLEGPTIEETLQYVLEQVLQEPIALEAASRTDRGVHAEGQVVAFITTKSPILSKLHASLNALLPLSIRVIDLKQVSHSFHPSLDSQGKRYQYFLCHAQVQHPLHRAFSWHVPYTLDIPTMQYGLYMLLGTHDFSSFCNTDGLKSHKTLCTLTRAELSHLPGQRFVFTLEGDRFLFRMVRIVVGTIVYLGRGKLCLHTISSLLKTRQRAAAGITAPAHGLFLMNVYYKESHVESQ